jgi:hypothetical protein
VGPTVLFDKSFLQALSVDEAVWFDHFFHANVAPVFFVESLADLAKSPARGRPPEHHVAALANKFPESGGMPNAFHANAVIAELLGEPIPMTGHILGAGGRRTKTLTRSGIVVGLARETQAFMRWQKGEFEEVEREFAREWRAALGDLDLSDKTGIFARLGVSGASCPSLESARRKASELIDMLDPNHAIEMLLGFVGAPPGPAAHALYRHQRAGAPRMRAWAPYSHHVLLVDLFFQVALAASLISTDRTSNRMDIAYLYYLPFCQVFTSCDRLHERCAPHFLRNDQHFLSGHALKSGLAEVNAHYARLPDHVRAQPIFSFAKRPPIAGDFLVSRIWDECWPGWREPKASRGLSPEARQRVAADVREFIEAAKSDDVSATEDDFHPGTVAIERLWRPRRGSWNMLRSPKRDGS